MTNGIEYIEHNGYYVPVIACPHDARSIGHFGRLRLQFLKEYHPILYTTLLLNGQMHDHLATLNAQANERLEMIIHQMQEAKGINEALKAASQMEWVGHMNSIRSRAEEIVMQELIYS